MAQRIALRAVAAKIAKREAFATHNGTLTGVRTDGEPFHGTGRLPEDWRRIFERQGGAGELAYVVTSYVTPIAWVLTDGTVIIPDARYSVTTTRHQGIARSGL